MCQCMKHPNYVYDLYQILLERFIDDSSLLLAVKAREVFDNLLLFLHVFLLASTSGTNIFDTLGSLKF